MPSHLTKPSTTCEAEAFRESASATGSTASRPTSLRKEKRSKRQPASDSKSKKVNVETLYNLSDDIGEQTNLIVEHPEIAQRLKRQLATFETDLRKNLRPAGVASEQ